MKFIREDEAVSPVIGTILMVAITVILAAVIAAFVFGMGSGVQKTKNVAVTAAQQGTNINVTLQGGADFQDLEWVNGTVNGNSTCGSGNNGLSGDNVFVGATMTCTGATPGADRVIVVGHFSDGTEQVLLDSSY